MKKTIIPVFILVVSSALAVPVLDIDFTAAEGFSDGVSLEGISGFNAQGNWIATNTAGSGYATLGGGWQRARNFANFSLEVGDSVVIETTLRLSSAVWPNSDVYSIGFAEMTIDAGGATPSIGSKIHTNGDGSFWIGSSDLAQRVDIPAAYSNDWIKFTQTITRSGSTNEFTGAVAATNLTAGADLGESAASWTQATTDGSWGGAMNAGFRGTHSGGVAIEIDRWMVSTITNIPPPVTNNVDVALDLTRQLYIGGVSTLNRDQILTWHTSAKKTGSDALSVDEAADMLDTNKVYAGRSVGGLNWIRSQMQDEDPLRPGYIDVDALTTWCLGFQDAATGHWPWQKGRYKTFIESDRETMFPGQTISGRFNPANNEAAAEWTSVVFSNYWTDPVRPVFFEPLNEPFVKKNDMGTDEQGIVDYHEAIIDRMHVDQPDLQVGGPCTAWPVFSRENYDHFRERVGLYIDQLGHKTDFISWHIYSTLTDDGDVQAHNLGANADWQIDLVENYAVNQTGREIPIVISEYGGGIKDHETSALWNTYSGLRCWHIIKSVMGKSMAFHERPDRIVKAMPFIVGKATWYPGYETNAYPYVSHHLVDGSWEETHLVKYYRFWKAVEGERFPATTTDPDVQVQLFITNTTAHLCLNNLEHNVPVDLNISAMLEGSASVQSASMTRLYFDGADPVLEEMVPLSTWTNISLQAQEAAIVHLELDQAPSRGEQLYRKSHYGDRTIVAYTNTPQTFTVLADMNRGAIHGAMLKVGVTREFDAAVTNITPIVSFNGQALPQATDWPGGTQKGIPGGTAGRDQFDGTIRMDVPAHLVQATNAVDVSFTTSGGVISTVILEVDSELPFNPNLQVEMKAPGMVIRWDSSPSFNYMISKSTNLMSGIWEPGEMLPGKAGVILQTNSTVDPNAFFKLEAIYP